MRKRVRNTGRAFGAAFWRVRLLSLETFINFGVVGVSGIVVNLATFTVLLQLGLNKYVASPIAVELSIVSNFLLNNYWTFKVRQTKDRVRIKGIKFNFVSLLSLGVSFSTFVAMSVVLPTLPPQLHQLIGIAPAMLVNYFLNSYWTFRSVATAPKQAP